MKKTRALLALAALFFGAGALSAFTLEPISTTIAPSGPESIATFRIKSEDPGRIAIRFRVLSRDLSAEGKEINGPADDLFLIYPSRMVVEPGAQAVVKIQWKGPSDIDAERCFRFVAEQVALDTGPATSSGIKMMFRYIASLYVGKPSFAAALEATAVGATGSDGSPGFLIGLRNTGTRHVVALDPRITLGNGLVKLPTEDLGILAGANYLPGKSIHVFIAKPDAVPGKSYDATVDYEGVY
ncbi:MAG TPA: hypothetical protein VMV83_10755 [Rectinemataceae bacterium]|nr:hypothetical protein [Rectinemataceae bacterium]